MKSDTLTFESVARLHMSAEPERQQAGLRAWAATLMGDAITTPEEEPLCTLKEIGEAVRLHTTWLWKLRVREHCGERLAGRHMYRKSRVLTYLQSPECQERIRELHEARKAREAL